MKKGRNKKKGRLKKGMVNRIEGEVKEKDKRQKER